MSSCDAEGRSRSNLRREATLLPSCATLRWLRSSMAGSAPGSLSSSVGRLALMYSAQLKMLSARKNRMKRVLVVRHVHPFGLAAFGVVGFLAVAVAFLLRLAGGSGVAGLSRRCSWRVGMQPQVHRMRRPAGARQLVHAAGLASAARMACSMAASSSGSLAGSGRSGSVASSRRW